MRVMYRVCALQPNQRSRLAWNIIFTCHPGPATAAGACVSGWVVSKRVQRLRRSGPHHARETRVPWVLGEPCVLFPIPHRYDPASPLSALALGVVAHTH